MLHYEKLPKKTASSTVAGVLFIGVCLSYSIVACGLLVFYTVIGLLSSYFYPRSTIILGGSEAGYLALFLLVAAVTAVMLSFLAYYMNSLSKLTYRLSRVMWLPTTLTAGLAWWQHSSSVFSYHISMTAVIAVAVIIPLGGIFPAVFLSSKPARKLHSR